MTVAITIERYLAISFPFKARSWMAPKRAKFLIAAVVTFSTLLAIPRFTSMRVGKNVIGMDIEPTKEHEYLIMSSSLNKLWYGTLKGGYNHIDFWLPLPLLILLNALIYYKVHRTRYLYLGIYNRFV